MVCREESEFVERLVRESPLVNHCIVHTGDNGIRVALITIDEGEAANMCREQIAGLVEQAVAHANRCVSTTEQIKRWTIVEGDLSGEAD